MKKTFLTACAYMAMGALAMAAGTAGAYATTAPQITAEGMFTSNGANLFENETTVTITVPAGTTVRYTLDETDPTADSPEYTGPIDIKNSTLVLAAAFDAAGNISDITELDLQKCYPAESDYTTAVANFKIGYKYMMTASDKVAASFAQTANAGYLYGTDFYKHGDATVALQSQAFTVTGGTNLMFQDQYGRYLAASETESTFVTKTSASAWTPEVQSDGSIKLSQKIRTSNKDENGNFIYVTREIKYVDGHFGAYLPDEEGVYPKFTLVNQKVTIWRPVTNTGMITSNREYLLYFDDRGVMDNGISNTSRKIAKVNFADNGDMRIENTDNVAIVGFGQNDEGKYDMRNLNGPDSYRGMYYVSASPIMSADPQYFTLTLDDADGYKAKMLYPDGKALGFYSGPNTIQFYDPANLSLPVIYYRVDAKFGNFPAGLKFASASYGIRLSDTTVDGLALEHSSNGTLTFSSSNPSVASVDAATGAITTHAIGSTTITVTCPAVEGYDAGEASYQLNVLAGDEIVKVNMNDLENIDAAGLTVDWVKEQPDIKLSQLLRLNSYGNDGKYVDIQNVGSYGSREDVDAYIMSPEIDLTNVIGANCDFRNAIAQQMYSIWTYAANPDGLPDALAYCKEHFRFGVREVGSSEWTEIAIPDFVTGLYGSADFEEVENSGVIDLSSFDGKKIQLGWHYITGYSPASGAPYLTAADWNIYSYGVYGKRVEVSLPQLLVNGQPFDGQMINANEAVTVSMNPEEGVSVYYRISDPISTTEATDPYAGFEPLPASGVTLSGSGVFSAYAEKMGVRTPVSSWDFSIETGISSVLDDAAEAQWYTVSGVRLNTLPTEKGMYIMRRGAQAKVVIIK